MLNYFILLKLKPNFIQTFDKRNKTRNIYRVKGVFIFICLLTFLSDSSLYSIFNHLFLFPWLPVRELLSFSIFNWNFSMLNVYMIFHRFSFKFDWNSKKTEPFIQGIGLNIWVNILNHNNLPDIERNTFFSPFSPFRPNLNL